jgi:FKBP-type peptidyl-prolyl cis-trans isomerases 1
MRKKLFFLPIFFFALCLGVTSCLNNDDDDDVVIDEEWKALNEKRFNDINRNEYSVLTSESGGGNIYWKESDVITKSDIKSNLKIAVDGKPEFTDTVLVRYEGWYFDKNGKEIIFDSTEGVSVKSELAYNYGASAAKDPNKTPVQMPVNGITDASKPNQKLIDGWVTLLMDMKEGEEREVVIPHQLGYGSNGYTYQPTSSSPIFTTIPAYTTLWFRLKVLKIIPMNGLKS